MEKKNQIIERLIREGHIGLDEALVLLGAEKETVFVPYTVPTYPEPFQPSWPIIEPRYKLTC